MDKDVAKVKEVLKKNSNGLTITELVEKSKIPRTKVRTSIHFLLGSKEIYERKIGMAKLYKLVGKK